MANVQTDSVVQRFQAVVRPHLRFLKQTDPFPMGENLGKLGLDSMAAINLLLDLEKEFQIQIPDSLLTAESFETGEGLMNMLSPLIPAESSGG